MNIWISIDFMKPDEDQKVLCYGKHFMCVGVYNGERFFDPLDGEDFCKDCVTHWMPLPEPPQ